MKFDIVTNLYPISTVNQFEPAELKQSYEYFIDGKLVPPSLARIIELGLAVQLEQYCKSMEDEMQFMRALKEGH